MEQCSMCPDPVDPKDPDTYHEVSTWVHGEKKDGATLRDYTGRVAHMSCVQKKQEGQAPGQVALF